RASAISLSATIGTAQLRTLCRIEDCSMRAPKQRHHPRGRIVGTNENSALPLDCYGRDRIPILQLPRPLVTPATLIQSLDHSASIARHARMKAKSLAQVEAMLQTVCRHSPPVRQARERPAVPAL